MEAWVVAREENDYAAFRPWLDRHLELKREYIACFEPADDPYDILLDDFEPGTTTAEVEVVFDRLKSELVPLIAASADAGGGLGDGPVPGGRPAADRPRRDDGLRLRARRRSGSTAPSIRSAPRSRRPTSASRRGTPRHDLESLFSCMHEIGHGLYERGVSPSLERTPLAAGCSSGLHESQSRLWENVIGRSLPFCRWLHPQLVATFPDALGHLTPSEFHAAVNSVQAVLHPRRCRRGHLRHAHHPAVRARAGADRGHALDRRSARTRGTRGSRSTSGSPSRTTGSASSRTCTGRAGLFGYFPTYQLGNVMSVQIWEAAQAALPDLEERFAEGEFGELGDWLRENLYSLGRKLTPKETLERVAGGPIDPEPYLRYLRDKYAVGVS